MPDTTLLRGLSANEAAARLAADGPNELPRDPRRGILRLAAELVLEPMFLLLFAAVTIYVVLGDVREAAVLAAFVVVVAGITLVQETRTERAIDALRALAVPHVRVARDGTATTIASRDLVRGDFVFVAEGDRVPADAVLRDGTSLSVDESTLTGESVPVPRHPEPESRVERGTLRASVGALFAGTLVASGRGWAEVVATGERTELGAIGRSLTTATWPRTPLQRAVDSAVRTMAIVGISAALLLVGLRVAHGDAWLPSILGGIAVAMSLLPEEFPVVLTVFLAIGARRIAADKVLTRRLPAVETLGAVSVLCTDKTGTLTQNAMSVRRLHARDLELDVGSRAGALPEGVHSLVEHAILASPRDPFDPMEKALIALGSDGLARTEHLHPRWEAVREFPLTRGLLAVTWLWRSDEATADPHLVVATKGAPEAVFDLCHLDAEQAARWRAHATRHATDGLRVLAVAHGRIARDSSNLHPHDVDFDLDGLIAFEDPLRESARDAISQCRAAGIRVLMITGDHPATALAIARAIGLTRASVLTGDEIDALDDDALGRAVDEVEVVARAVPAQKLRIVETLRRRGRVVGMTGDGVNDAPALRAADIGIAMGVRGTDVAREAAALVLADDDFASLVAAVRTGRRIDDNLRKSIEYIVSVHVPIAALAVVPALLDWPPLLTPMLVVVLELIIDPTCSIVFELEPAEPDSMRRPPRPMGASPFARDRMIACALRGAAVAAAALAAVGAAHAAGLSDGEQRTVAFLALVSGNLALLVTGRSRALPFWRLRLSSNRAALALVVGASVFATATVLVEPLRNGFGFGAPSPTWCVLAAIGGALPALVLDLAKLRSRPVPPST